MNQRDGHQMTPEAPRDLSFSGAMFGWSFLKTRVTVRVDMQESCLKGSCFMIKRKKICNVKNVL